MDSTLEALVQRIREATAHGTPLRLRGGGTKDFLAARANPSADAAGDVLDTRAHAGVVRHEPSELYVTARCGTPLADLESLLAGHGQCLPFEPPHFGAGATVGGMVAAGLSGPPRASVGSVRDHVLGVNAVNGRGEQLVFGGQVMKNVAGYDLSRLYAGTWGTLGLIAEVSLKVLPVAPAQATLAFDLPQAEALERLHTWGAQPLPLNASTWVQDGDSARNGWLLVRLRGAAAAVQAACARMGGQRVDDDAAASHWAGSRELALPFFCSPPSSAHALWRLSVAQTAPAVDLPADISPPMVDWHGAQRWVWATPARAGLLRDAARAAGGHATLFRPPADGAPVHGLRATPLAEPLARIQRALKSEFDPAGIFVGAVVLDGTA